jgi:hypothetical protein
MWSTSWRVAPAIVSTASIASSGRRLPSVLMRDSRSSEMAATI